MKECILYVGLHVGYFYIKLFIISKSKSYYAFLDHMSMFTNSLHNKNEECDGEEDVAANLLGSNKTTIPCWQ